MRPSVHDNWVYAQTADYMRRRLVLHTVFPHVEPAEYTDIVFEGVVAYHLEQQAVGDGPYPPNVLFDVEEADPKFVLDQYAELLARTKNYGWPVLGYDGPDDLASRLTAGGAKCFQVESTCGLCGFVFAKTAEFRPRPSPADIACV